MNNTPTPTRMTVLPVAHAEILDFHWGQLTWFANSELGNCAEMTIGRCILAPGCANPVHRHPNCTEILVVQTGRIMHLIEDGTEVEMNPGDTISIPANLPHRARNIGDTPAVLTIVFSSGSRETVGE